MKLSTIRDLLIVIAIYLYFIAWIYLHTYYSHFGIATESLRLDYSSYMVFSYNVLQSTEFLLLAGVSVMIFILGGIFLPRFLKGKTFTAKRRIKKLLNCLLVFFLVSLFPILYRIAHSTATDNYVHDRTSIGSRRRVEFIFKSDSGVADSALSSSYHLRMVLKDEGRTLRLLGETDEHYIVLNQRPFDTLVRSFPEGSVYYVNKKDVMLSRVVLSSR
jgi:hypothetical protein